MVGELALNGAVRPVKGVLPIALRARQDGKVGVLVPPENAAEAAVVVGLAGHPGAEPARGGRFPGRRDEDHPDAGRHGEAL